LVTQKKVLLLCLATFHAFVFAGCGGGGDPAAPDGGGEIEDPLPEWTVMVYLAADNNLAWSGLEDLQEMEAAGNDPDVKVVVEFEFSPSYLEQAGYDLASINLPNGNTYRYLVDGDHNPQPGANDPIDLGRRNMADPDELREFVTWAMQTHPAERYALVLWNHGGGYTGLIEDATDGGPDMMTLAQLRQGLDGLGPIDLVDFDMCLMGAYETLVTMEDLASYVVFSEELVPGPGNPYTEIIDSLQENPTASTSDVAAMFVDRFHASYQDGRSSTTKSAYDMANFGEFETSLEALANTLRTRMSAFSTAIGESAAGAQKYSCKQLKDLIDFLRLLKQNTTDGALHTQIDAVVAEASAASFRIANQKRSVVADGYGQADADVSGSNGMHILMPSGGEDDPLPESGGGSFGAYESLYANRAWTLFLADWLADASTTPTEDQNDSILQAILAWDPASIDHGVDIDFLIIEPDGNVYAPYMGPVTPNGTFTEDSAITGGNYEGYQMKRIVAQGVYLFVANLYSDPENFQPQYDLLTRLGSSADFQSLFDPSSYPSLSLEASWRNDPTPTAAELADGAYSDLQIVASFTVGSAGDKACPIPVTLTGNQGGRSQSLPTQAQIKTLQQYVDSKPIPNASSTGRTSVPAVIEFALGGKK